MHLPKLLHKQEKKGGTAYSAVEVDADGLDAKTDKAPTAPDWPAELHRIENAPTWLDGRDVSPHGKHIQDALLIGPMIYPLDFTALGGRALRKFALWKSGEGATLGFLKHMVGSQSLVATVGHALTLHSLDVLTVALLAFWTLSPLGSQSVLRILCCCLHRR
ncbi:hypothetical protein BU25DRAFT_417489 [Macroventuria anomochaeta]|uniref:Uncharacterized protein n=1 Tax=Macroventuria anomochaeta TaxID=301207 RepID=A0ACB6SHG0_9PLEO|nr:uncharacterized protein BU25DRAFT_417489 [Macroventuria anomochaeta]KAF2632922.1 hypothetical protein BU25DRAFT_417489 [Macroventuria anomochaeta]